MSRRCSRQILSCDAAFSAGYALLKGIPITAIVRPPAQSPGSKEWSGKAGAARAETPQPTTARTRTLARKRAHLFDSSFYDAQTERGNSSGPDLRGDWGVETEAGAYERPLDGLQPHATLD